MKPHLIVLIAFTLIISCSNNKAAQEQPVAEAEKQPENVSKAEISQSSGDGITGNWKLILEAYDDNGNKILDDAERKKGWRNRYTFRFNADGSCLIQEVYKGRYEEKTEGGKKMLYVYRNRVKGEEDADPPPDIYRIISMSKTELVLLDNLADLTFWVFERGG